MTYIPPFNNPLVDEIDRMLADYRDKDKRPSMEYLIHLFGELKSAYVALYDEASELDFAMTAKDLHDK